LPIPRRNQFQNVVVVIEVGWCDRYKTRRELRTGCHTREPVAKRWRLAAGLCYRHVPKLPAATDIFGRERAGVDNGDDFLPSTGDIADRRTSTRTTSRARHHAHDINAHDINAHDINAHDINVLYINVLYKPISRSRAARSRGYQSC
jgi:hypothetical protein